MRNLLLPLVAAGFMIDGCQTKFSEGSFGRDIELIQEFQETLVLEANEGRSQIAVVPAYQGRIMTSTANGMRGRSYGWVNHALISSGEFVPHVNAFGGEDRFWMGPEGGQFSIFFEGGKDFTLANWFTPKAIDTEPFQLVEQGDASVQFAKRIQLTNYSGFTFDVEVDRTVSLFDANEVEKHLSVSLGSEVAFVGFQSDNSITNVGSVPWTYERGVLSVWILGMFVPTPNTVVIVPYRDALQLNTSYFGEVADDRLLVTDQAVLFKADGQYRSKIGLPPANSTPFIGSFDIDNQVLTIVRYTVEGDTAYVNSLWEIQEDPYAGDVVNTYNDGPLDDGSIMGPFYELESSSPARALKSGETIRHIHQTYHFEGPTEDLNRIAQATLDVDLSAVVREVKHRWK